MKYVNVDGMTLSTLSLGGGKMVDMSITEGIKLVLTAKELGINNFDCHHRYGNCEEIISTQSDVYKMTKVSAYCSAEEAKEFFFHSKKLLRMIDLLWISDLDDPKLYHNGCKLYEFFKNEVKRIGITSESPSLVMNFAIEYVECKFLMIPMYAGSMHDYEKTADRLMDEGKYVFTIKPFDDGRAIKKYSVEECLDYILSVSPTVTVFGTKNIEHLKEVVKIWEEL